MLYESPCGNLNINVWIQFEIFILQKNQSGDIVYAFDPEANSELKISPDPSEISIWRKFRKPCISTKKFFDL